MLHKKMRYLPFEKRVGLAVLEDELNPYPYEVTEPAFSVVGPNIQC